ncbi:hypothetical protein CTAYLR_007081 [Chrysophaeum taylorii]|uniref:Uncharacterized protein n=1 Tax=Chrysophaeum taylorii TaxID=2483200 RepID=A0AAD7UMG4_9STRA|nr:hypothetical protein CTAYLR_007081 [Chrysophaeum taylorii]
MMEGGLPKEALDVVHEMSELLDTGLNRRALDAIARLCDEGVVVVGSSAMTTQFERRRQPVCSRARCVVSLSRAHVASVVRELSHEKEAIGKRRRQAAAAAAAARASHQARGDGEPR